MRAFGGFSTLLLEGYLSSVLKPPPPTGTPFKFCPHQGLNQETSASQHIPLSICILIWVWEIIHVYVLLKISLKLFNVVRFASGLSRYTRGCIPTTFMSPVVVSWGLVPDCLLMLGATRKRRRYY